MGMGTRPDTTDLAGWLLGGDISLGCMQNQSDQIKHIIKISLLDNCLGGRRRPATQK